MITALVAGAGLGLASNLHCAAMCGPLAAASCTTRRQPGDWALYLLGRLMSYTLLGALAAGVLSGLSTTLRGPWPAAVVSWTYAAALLFGAIKLWPRHQVSAPALVQLKTGRPPSIGARLVARLLGRPWALGAAQALLPCGALAAAVVLAAGQQGPLAGASLMASFAMTSSFGLAGVGAGGRALARLRTPNVARGLAVILAVAGATLVVRPLQGLKPQATDAMPATCPMHADDTRMGAAPSR